MDDFAMACLREVSSLDSRLEHTRYWYGQRMTRLEKWAREELSEPLRTRFFNIVANGTPDVMEPPTSEQNYNGMKHRAEKAESELVRFQASTQAVSRAHGGLMLTAAADLESWMKTHGQDAATQETVRQLRAAALGVNVWRSAASA